MPRYAAIDIGSNSIRLMAAEVEQGRVAKTLIEDRQVTRLGESVFRTGRISDEAGAFVTGVLARMVAAYKQLDVLAARIVATAAVRDASNGEEFLARCTEAAGQTVELISGQEEARLIQRGVATRWPHPDERILIVDIGGGSAEVIWAEHDHLRAAVSRPLGAVRLHSVFLRQNDPPTPVDLTKMQEYIDEKLLVAVKRIGRKKFARVIATSASASAVVCAADRIPRTRRDEADRSRAPLTEIHRLYRRLAKMDVAQRRAVTGIGPRRAEIILPGIAVLARVLEEFRMPSLYYCAAGVRDGIIRDLADRGVGSERARMSREQRENVEALSRRFGVDLPHARKVAAFGRELFHALEQIHRLAPEHGRLLEGAALLRDVGHFISDTSHHKHSHYIVANCDLAGFTEAERRIIAMLCRYHRKNMPAPRHDDYQALPPEDRRAILLLAPILRIADALDRSRDQRVEDIVCEIRPQGVYLTLAAKKDVALEQWAVERVVPEFRQIYERTLITAAIRA